jgi:hypothetical protein
MGAFSLASAKELYKARSKTPWALWHRPFGFLDTTTPRVDERGITAFILQRILKGRKSEDTPPKKQSTTTPKLIRLQAMSNESVSLNHAIGKLTSGSYFYAMYRSGPRKAKLLLVEDINFTSPIERFQSQFT